MPPSIDQVKQALSVKLQYGEYSPEQAKAKLQDYYNKFEPKSAAPSPSPKPTPRGGDVRDLGLGIKADVGYIKNQMADVERSAGALLGAAMSPVDTLSNMAGYAVGGLERVLATVAEPVGVKTGTQYAKKYFDPVYEKSVLKDIVNLDHEAYSKKLYEGTLSTVLETLPLSKAATTNLRRSADLAARAMSKGADLAGKTPLSQAIRKSSVIADATSGKLRGVERVLAKSDPTNILFDTSVKSAKAVTDMLVNQLSKAKSGTADWVHHSGVGLNKTVIKKMMKKRYLADDPIQFLKRHKIYGSTENMISGLRGVAEKATELRDAAISGVKHKTQSPSAEVMLNNMKRKIKGIKDELSDPVRKEYARVEELLSPRGENPIGGLKYTVSELQEIKKRFSQPMYSPFPDTILDKTTGAKKNLQNHDHNVQKQIEVESGSPGLVKDANKRIQIAETLARDMEGALIHGAKNLLGLTDIMVARMGGTPSAGVKWGIARRIIEAPALKTRMAQFLNHGASRDFVAKLNMLLMDNTPVNRVQSAIKNAQIDQMIGAVLHEVKGDVAKIALQEELRSRRETKKKNSSRN